ncbi:MAG: N-acetylneuraminate synthase family protein [Magnetococcales bacterium]|nr:N-acetylneuraminate synthase family protein [Magnetococcales bacterium]MBF0148968.1 N-acetylneuraminate synthase family protein [Magnetococcales bacterium]MBF0603034.1 N-acetylneuraminate synthase family protein [Magnetococcales bacterium]
MSSPIKIGGHVIGEHVFIIAEVGSNHLGNLDMALKTLQAGAEAGVDAVKFQMFNPDQLVTRETPVYKHVPDNRFRTQKERFKHMALSRESFLQLARAAEDLGVQFLCTPFDRESAEFLDPLIDAYKIASGDSSNFALVDYAAAKGKPMIVSTGLCEQAEVDRLVERLPQERTVLLHCVGSYPTPDNQVNLALIPFYRKRYAIPIGYSDHTADILAPLAATALGAVVVEKHFILDRGLAAGDRDLSLVPAEMKRLVDEIRRLEAMWGTVPRRITPAEVYGRSNLRRSPYTLRTGHRGEVFGIEDILFLRPESPVAHSLERLTGSSSLRLLQDLDEEVLLTPENSEWVDVTHGSGEPLWKNI